MAAQCSGCWRACQYARFKAAPTFGEVKASLYVESSNPADWKYKRRGTALGIMHAHKRDCWNHFTEHCPHQGEPGDYKRPPTVKQLYRHFQKLLGRNTHTAAAWKMKHEYGPSTDTGCSLHVLVSGSRRPNFSITCSFNGRDWSASGPSWTRSLRQIQTNMYADWRERSKL